MLHKELKQMEVVLIKETRELKQDKHEVKQQGRELR